jgi:DHA3 family tetracycline resistance protein-like MFS transporter
VVLYWAVGVLRGIHGPLSSTWFNQRIDGPQVRATMFSVRGQVDAVGQIGGGPIMGMIGNVSIRAALVVSAAILSPVLPLYWIAIHRDE